MKKSGDIRATLDLIKLNDSIYLDEIESPRIAEITRD